MNVNISPPSNSERPYPTGRHNNYRNETLSLSPVFWSRKFASPLLCFSSLFPLPFSLFFSSLPLCLCQSLCLYPSLSLSLTLPCTASPINYKHTWLHTGHSKSSAPSPHPLSPKLFILRLLPIHSPPFLPAYGEHIQPHNYTNHPIPLRFPFSFISQRVSVFFASLVMGWVPAPQHASAREILFRPGKWREGERKGGGEGGEGGEKGRERERGRRGRREGQTSKH